MKLLSLTPLCITCTCYILLDRVALNAHVSVVGIIDSVWIKCCSRPTLYYRVMKIPYKYLNLTTIIFVHSAIKVIIVFIKKN